MRMIDTETLKESYRIGHGVDFCTGREMVIDGSDDLSETQLRFLCIRIWGADYNEVVLGIEYQRGIMRAAEALLKQKRRKK